MPSGCRVAWNRTESGAPSRGAGLGCRRRSVDHELGLLDRAGVGRPDRRNPRRFSSGPDLSPARIRAARTSNCTAPPPSLGR